MTRTPSPWVLYGGFLFALVFMVMPLPAQVGLARPYLLALLLCYWLLEAPERIGLGSAFLLGLFADLVSGSLLGEQALRLVVVAFLVQRFRARLRFFPLWQQALAVFVILMNDRLLALAIRLVAGDAPPPVATWLAPAAAFLVWPWLFLLLDELRLRLRERNA